MFHDLNNEYWGVNHSFRFELVNVRIEGSANLGGKHDVNPGGPRFTIAKLVEITPITKNDCRYIELISMGWNSANIASFGHQVPEHLVAPSLLSYFNLHQGKT